MTPFSALVKTSSPAPEAPASELSLSLLISEGALRLVNTVERSLNQVRRRK